MLCCALQRARSLPQTARGPARRRTLNSRPRGRSSGRSTSGIAPATAVSATARHQPRARSCFLVWRLTGPLTASPPSPALLIRRPSALPAALSSPARLIWRPSMSPAASPSFPTRLIWRTSIGFAPLAPLLRYCCRGTWSNRQLPRM